MSPEALTAWISLYAGVAVLAALCAVGAIIQTTHELITGVWRPVLGSRLQMALALPKIWLRWQLNYLRGFPVIAGAAIYFAWYIGFDVLGNVK